MKELEFRKYSAYTIGFLAIVFNLYFFVKGYLTEFFPARDVLFIKEKVLLTLYKDSTQVLGDGIVKPILPYLVNLFIPDIPLLTAIVSTLLIFTLISYISKKSVSIWKEFLIVVLIIFNPLFFLTAIKNYIFTLTLLVFLVAIFSIYVFLYIKPRQYVYLFLGSFLLGFTFLVDYRSIFATFGIILMAIINDILKFKKHKKTLDLRRLWNIILILLTPTLFFIFFYMFTNFLITERFEFDFYNRYLTLGFYPTEYFSNFPLSLRATFDDMIRYWYLVLPSLVIPLISRKKFFGLIYIFSGTLLIAGIYYFSGNVPVYYFLIFSLLPLISIIDTKHNYLNLKMNLSILTLALTLGFTVKDIDFKPFLKKDKELVDMYKASKVLKSLKVNNVILDDKTLYPVVVFYGDVNRIIFPYQFDFVNYYANPKNSVDIVVVNKLDKTDKFLKKYPNAKYGYLEGYYVLYENETVIIFKNINFSNSSNISW